MASRSNSIVKCNGLVGGKRRGEGGWGVESSCSGMVPTAIWGGLFGTKSNSAKSSKSYHNKTRGGRLEFM